VTVIMDDMIEPDDPKVSPEELQATFDGLMAEINPKIREQMGKVSATSWRTEPDEIANARLDQAVKWLMNHDETPEEKQQREAFIERVNKALVEGTLAVSRNMGMRSIIPDENGYIKEWQTEPGMSNVKTNPDGEIVSFNLHEMSLTPPWSSPELDAAWLRFINRPDPPQQESPSQPKSGEEPNP